MKPSSFIFWAEPDGPPAQRRTSFCLFQMWCHMFTPNDLKNCFLDWLSSPRGTKSQRIRRRMRNAASELSLMSNEASQSVNASLILVFLCEYEKSALFLLISLLLGGFCPNDTFLFVHQSACFMNVLQWTVFVSLLEKKKKTTAQGYQNPRKRLVQLNLYVIN